MKKSTPIQPIVFALSNVENNNMHFSGIFSFIVFLLLVEESNVHGYIKYLNYFTPDQFRLLSKRIMDKRNKEVPMNQNHLIIFYASLYFIIQIFESEIELQLLKENLTDVNAVEDMTKLKEYLTSYAGDSIKQLQKDYKNNYSIAVAFSKINAYQIPH